MSGIEREPRWSPRVRPRYRTSPVYAYASIKDTLQHARMAATSLSRLLMVGDLIGTEQSERGVATLALLTEAQQNLNTMLDQVRGERS